VYEKTAQAFVIYSKIHLFSKNKKIFKKVIDLIVQIIKMRVT